MSKAHPAQVDPERVAKLFRDGLSATIIAKRLGAHTETIRRRLEKMFGTSAPSKPYCAELVTSHAMAGSQGFRHRPHFIEHDNGPGAV